LYIDQTKFVKDIPEKTSMQEANGKFIPMQKDRKERKKSPLWTCADEPSAC
jgi:hypothetical protein